MAKLTLMITFLAALVTFSAFGAAIMAFLAGGGLDSVAAFWIKRGEEEAAKRGRQVNTQREADTRKKTVRGVSLLFIALIQIISGIGMTACGLWLMVMAQHWTWGWVATLLYWLGVSTFLADTGLITLLIFAAVVLLTLLQPRFSTKPETG
jgi:hypothetical protein